MCLSVLINVLMVSGFFISSVLASIKVKEFTSPHIIFMPLTSQKGDAKKVSDVLMNKEIMANSYGPRQKEWIKKLIQNVLVAENTTPLGLWLLYLKEDHSFMGICGFKAGNRDTTFKESPENPEGNGVPYSEAGGLRKDDRTELGSSSILLYPSYTSYTPEITSALIHYAFEMTPQLIGIDFGVQSTNKVALEDMEHKKISLLVPPYDVNRGLKYPMIKMYVFRCDRAAYHEYFPLVIKD